MTIQYSEAYNTLSARSFQLDVENIPILLHLLVALPRGRTSRNQKLAYPRLKDLGLLGQQAPSAWIVALGDLLESTTFQLLLSLSILSQGLPELHLQH
jgi:hypothetical protein